MEYQKYTVTSHKNKLITLDVIPGHFTTSNSHLTHYLDMNRLKFNALLARDIAREMAVPYLSNGLIDTIICMEGTEVIGAYLAEDLMENGAMVVNSDKDIYVVTPISNINGQLVFTQNAQQMIYRRHIVLLVASTSSGYTINRALDCLKYYKGILAGISSIFSAIPEVSGYPVNSIFSSKDILGYRTYKPSDCALCRAGRQLDAIVNHDGYTRF